MPSGRSPQWLKLTAQDFKGELITQANAIAADAEEFCQLVRTEVSAEIIIAKGKGTEALALLSRSNGIQTNLVNTAINDAQSHIKKAQTPGVSHARKFKEELQSAVQELSYKVGEGEARNKITQTEAAKLQDILSDCLAGCLTSVNQTLEDIGGYLDQATLGFQEARAYVNLPSPTTRELQQAKRLVSSAMRNLERAW